MSITPITPCKLEFHFGFESSPLKPRCYWIHLLKMAKYPVIITGSLLVLYFCILQVHSAPSLLDSEDTLYKDRTATKRLIMEQLKWDKESKAAALPSPPADEDLDSEGSQTVFPTVDITPRKLHFVKSTRCKLHRKGTSEEKTALVCGYRQVDVAEGMSGVMLWKPGVCKPHHCRCAPTQEVKRMRRTVIGGKTTMEYHRYRVFECI